LNRQLSTEAFYAADSGINNAAAIISASDGSPVAETTSCNTANPYTVNNQLDSTNVTYSCVTVNTSPTSLMFDIPVGSPYVFPVDVGGASTLNSIKLSWDNNNNTDYSGCPAASGATSGTFTPAADWSTVGKTCDASVLEVNMISAANSASLVGEETGSYTLFMYPTQKGASSGTFGNGSIYDAACVTGAQCSVTISGFPASEKYYLRISSLYSDSALTVTGNNGAPLFNAQAEIDSTGKAQDVLQRLNARVCIAQGTCSEATPAYAVQSGDSLCKLIKGYPKNGVNAGSASIGILNNTAPSLPTTDSADTLGCSLD
jgi:hypothetical protein